MANPVVIGNFSKKTIKSFEMLQCEVTFDDGYFHHVSQLTDLNFHNAYDADEDFSLFRADAVFTYGGTDYVVPVFAVKDKKDGDWKWLIRFRPHFSGSWRLRVKVLCWHPNPGSDESEKAKRTSHDGKTYYEHEFGYANEDYRKHPGAEQRFSVADARLAGPLEVPDKEKKDNYHYFYRWTQAGEDYNRRPFFLLGIARPWVTPSGPPYCPPGVYDCWDSFLDREKDLFVPMHNTGCNVLYHWMAPWETQLVHQSQSEYWPDSKGLLQGPYPSTKLSAANAGLGYKRYDQGRALLTDRIFDLADKYQILLFVSVMSHQSLQDPHHPWGEHGWSGDDPPSKLNGFQLFKRSATESGIDIRTFFEMKPEGGATSWKRRLWKHFANFWRYIIGRWTAHPALGAWVLIDELEGIGKEDDWWWKNKEVTGLWHNNLIRLIRGKLRWKWEGKDLPFTGDYLKHPLTTSTTHYEWKLSLSVVPHSVPQILARIDNFGELPDHGTWQGTPQAWLGSSSQKREQLDFLSNHAYQAIPTWGEWTGSAGSRHYEGGFLTGRWSGWRLTNSSGTEHIDTDRWLWDSLCMRLRNWVRAKDEGSGKSGKTVQIPKLVTEYGCLEREKPEQPWDYLGPRSPSFTHLANWAALALGHAGVPFKWNDGALLGEMIGRASSRGVWERHDRYPIDNYAEIVNIANFLKGTVLDDLFPEELSIVKEDETRDTDFNVWALIDSKRRTILAWIYNRTFGTTALSKKHWLRIDGTGAARTYSYSWFDTWSGREMTGGQGEVQSNAKGMMKIPVPVFPRSSKMLSSHSTGHGADGHDIAIRLIAK